MRPAAAQPSLTLCLLLDFYLGGVEQCGALLTARNHQAACARACKVVRLRLASAVTPWRARRQRPVPRRCARRLLCPVPRRGTRRPRTRCGSSSSRRRARGAARVPLLDLGAAALRPHLQPAAGQRRRDGRAHRAAHARGHRGHARVQRRRAPSRSTRSSAKMRATWPTTSPLPGPALARVLAPDCCHGRVLDAELAAPTSWAGVKTYYKQPAPPPGRYWLYWPGAT